MGLVNCAHDLINHSGVLSTDQMKRLGRRRHPLTRIPNASPRKNHKRFAHSAPALRQSQPEDCIEALRPSTFSPRRSYPPHLRSIARRFKDHRHPSISARWAHASSWILPRFQRMPSQGLVRGPAANVTSLFKLKEIYRATVGPVVGIDEYYFHCTRSGTVKF